MARTNSASENDAPKTEVEVEEPVMSTADLLKLVASLTLQLKESSKAQTDAILELASPKEPLKTKGQLAQEQNEEMFRKQTREQEERTKLNTKYAQENCEHIAGCSQLSEQKDIAGRTSFIWHRGDVGQTTGICTVCGLIVYQDDPDFAKWRRKKSFNKDSAAGPRTVMDPIAAMKLASLRDKP